MPNGTWVNVKMKHLDGRTGVIVSDTPGFCHRSLTIRIDGQEQKEYLQLNADGQDSGALGWQWLRSAKGEPEAWSLLGDHNPREATA